MAGKSNDSMADALAALASGDHADSSVGDSAIHVDPNTVDQVRLDDSPPPSRAEPVAPRSAAPKIVAPKSVARTGTPQKVVVPVSGVSTRPVTKVKPVAVAPAQVKSVKPEKPASPSEQAPAPTRRPSAPGAQVPATPPSRPASPSGAARRPSSPVAPSTPSVARPASPVARPVRPASPAAPPASHAAVAALAPIAITVAPVTGRVGRPASPVRPASPITSVPMPDVLAPTAPANESADQNDQTGPAEDDVTSSNVVASPQAAQQMDDVKTTDEPAPVAEDAFVQVDPEELTDSQDVEVIISDEVTDEQSHIAEEQADDAAVIAPAPSPEAFAPKRKAPTRPVSKVMQPFYATLKFRQTVIPVMLTGGALFLLVGLSPVLVDTDSPLADLPTALTVALCAMALVLLGLAVMNMLQVKQQLNEQK